MVRVLALVTSLVLAGPLAAFAQGAEPEAAAADEQGYGRNGFYVGAIFAGVAHQGITSETKHRTREVTGLEVDSHAQASAGVSARVGYRMHPRVATEVQWEWVSPTDIRLTGEIEDNSAYEAKSWLLTANLKGFILPTGNLQPFLLLGGGVLDGQLKDTGGYGYSVHEFGFVGRMGGGVDFYFTRNVVGTLDVTYVLPVGDVSVFSFVSAGVGLQYRF